MTDEDNAYTQADSDKQLSKDGSRVAMFRLYNQYTGEHFYTSSISERDSISKVGWKYEKIEWYAPTGTKKKPVYRLYNPYVSGGDHHYTTNATEKDNCVKQGWKYEGIGWYTVDKGEADRVSVLRQYNPFATTGTHNYTTNKSENDKLVKLGWKAEGEGWGGYSKLEPSSSALDFSKISVTTTAKTYNGKAQTQTIKSSAYKLNTDYTVTYSNNKNAGTASIVVKGKGNYTGSKTYKFTINKLNISNATVTLGTALTYNTKEQTQTIKSVKVGSLTLTTSDYTVLNNKATNAGSNYALTVTGKGNFVGTATKAFTINQAETTCEVPVGPTAKTGTTLSSIDITTIEKNSNVDGSLSWVNASTVLSDAGTNNCDATFVPNDKNYKTITVKVPVEVGTYFVTINTQDHGTKTHQKAIDEGGRITLTESDFGVSTGLTMQGWYKNAACYGNAVDTSTYLFNDGDVLYANWVPTDNSEEGNLSYWIGPSYNYIAEGKNEKARTSSNDASATQQERCNYVAEEWNVLKSSTEIKKDVADMNAEIKSGKTVDDEGTVLNEYQKIMEQDKYHLYTIYKGGENEPSTDSAETLPNQKGEASKLNKYVEFRIIEVGRHQLANTVGNDGSTVTFMATHVLPTAYQMNDTLTNSGGWGASQLQNKMNDIDGEIYEKFSSNFAGQVKTVTKQYGASGTEGVTSGLYKFWLLSNSELAGSNAPLAEGSQYAWCSMKSVTWASTNAVLVEWKTRAGDIPGSASYTYETWWVSSRCRVGDGYFMGVRSNGALGENFVIAATDADRVVPAFSF